MNGAIELAEYESRAVELDADQARELSLAAGDRLQVGFAADRGAWVITAKQYVGTVSAGRKQIHILPKVPIENLFAMLDVGVPADAWAPEVARYASDRDLLPAIAAFYARLLDSALASGLHRAYEEEHERLQALRGRVDFPEVIRHPGVPIPIASRYDDYTADIELNRLLLRATQTLLRIARLPDPTRRSLHRQELRFEGVGDEYVDASFLDRFHFDRLTSRYESIARLGALVLQNATLLQREGSVRASAFLLDMNDLFQRFVTDRLMRALRGKIEVVADPRTKTYLGEKRRVPMYPDLGFKIADRLAYVGDVKYKISGGPARNADYYQLLAYLVATGLDEGVLIYCRVDGDEEPIEVVVKGTRQRLDVYRVDLSGSFEALEESMLSLARWISDRARLSAGRLSA